MRSIPFDTASDTVVLSYPSQRMSATRDRSMATGRVDRDGPGCQAGPCARTRAGRLLSAIDTAFERLDPCAVLAEQ